jgi:Ca2+/H+ antiporter, TMEM165/GDT1 family
MQDRPMLFSNAAISAVSAAFLASLVEVVEAFTIILAVGTVRGWRPAAAGTVAGLVALSVMVAVLGPELNQIPIGWMQIAIGTLLLLFGLRWLRKAILRYAGVVPLHDESAAFVAATMELGKNARQSQRKLDWIAGITAFKAVLLEGLKVVFIVIAVGAGHGLLWPASIGAAAAGALVLVAGFAVQRPLARVPENTLKFAVGVLLSSFGVYWSGEGLGVAWPGSDLALVGFVLVFLVASLFSVGIARNAIPEAVA